jgi:hypothetical protein
MTKRKETKRTAAELYRLAQAQTLIDIYANGEPTEAELAKHYTSEGKIIPTVEAYAKITN